MRLSLLLLQLLRTPTKLPPQQLSHLAFRERKKERFEKKGRRTRDSKERRKKTAAVMLRKRAGHTSLASPSLSRSFYTRACSTFCMSRHACMFYMCKHACAGPCTNHICERPHPALCAFGVLELSTRTSCTSRAWLRDARVLLRLLALSPHVPGCV